MSKTFLFSLLVILLGGSAEAATWHVKSPTTCPNNGNGTAATCAASAGAAGAWNNPVSAFQSVTVTCGDIVQFYTGSWTTANNGSDPSEDGGFTITVNSAGCSGNPIIFKNASGQSPELRNCPLGSTSWAQCSRPTLNLVDKSYIIIDGFNIVGAIYNSTAIPAAYNGTVTSLRRGIILRNNNITVGWGEVGDGNWAGIWMSWTNGLWIQNNYVHDIAPGSITGSGSQSSATCVKFYTDYAHLTEFNSCKRVTVTDPVGGSQAGGFDDKQDVVDGVIRYNWCEDVDTCVRVQNQLMSVTPRLFTCASGGQAYGNIMIARSGSTRAAIKIESGAVCNYTAFNNTIINFHQCFNVQPELGNEQTDGLQWYNNICSGILNRNVLSFMTNLTDIDLEDYNAYTSTADYQTSAGTQTSLTAYVAAVPARNAHSSEVNCLFVNATNFHLQGGSPCKAGQSSTGRIGGVVGGATIDRGAYHNRTCVGAGCVPPGSFTITRTDITPPTVNITSPTSSSTYDAGTLAALTLSGTAVDDVAVTQCTWQSSFGNSGSATGTATWTASAVPLSIGTTVITVSCRDAIGNVGIDTLSVTRTSGATSGFFVRTDGNDSNIGTANTAAAAWRTIGKCASTLIAGQICRVQAGTYSGNISETTPGTAGNTLTYVADGAVTLNGSFALSAGYIRIIGFTINCSGVNDCITATGNSDGIEIWNNTCSGFIEFCYVNRGTGPSAQADINDDTIVIGNVSVGDVNVNNAHIGLFGSHNIGAYNTLAQSGNDYFYFYGQQVRIYNNYAWGPANLPIGGQHSDFVQTGVASGRTVGSDFFNMEANFYVGNPPELGDQHFTNQETAPDFSGNYLSRRNVVHNGGGGGQGIFSFASVFVAHDFYSEMQRSEATNPGSLYLSNIPIGRLNNNLFYDAWGASVTNAVVFDAAGSVSNFNMAWDISSGAAMSYCCQFAASTTEITTQQPLFTAYSSDDFHPTVSAPQRNAAGALTTTSGSGTGTTFTVAANGAGFFRGFDSAVAQYGGNLAAGDIITIGTDVRRIQSISGDVITVTQPFTWVNGDGVYYGNNAIDNAIGPYPYRAGGFTLTGTYSCNGSTCTTVPSDATITRMVICYNDRVPYQVVIDPPFVCTQPSGAFESRVYPLYASKVLWAVATP